MKTFSEVDVLVIGMGWTGGIASKELAEAGLTVVALERGESRTCLLYTSPSPRD